MAKFIYRMQSILDIKEKLMEQAKNEFAQARLALDEEEEKLKKLKQRQHFYEMEKKKLLSGKLSVLDLMENANAIEQIKLLIADQKTKVERAKMELEMARKRLEEAMKESKTHEKLRENAFEEFKKEENARESREIDELVSYTYGQRRKREHASR